MTAPRPKLRVFLDEGAPVSIGRAFEDAGHEVIYFNDALTPGSPDLLVCMGAELNDAILVAYDQDMKALAKRQNMGRAKFRRLSLIRFDCRESRAGARTREVMSLIEHEWQVRQGVRDRRIFIVVGDAVIRSHR